MGETLVIKMSSWIWSNRKIFFVGYRVIPECVSELLFGKKLKLRILINRMLFVNILQDAGAYWNLWTKPIHFSEEKMEPQLHVRVLNISDIGYLGKYSSKEKKPLAQLFRLD